MKTKLTIGYNDFIVSNEFDLNSFMHMIKSLTPVESKYINPEYIYTPTNDILNVKTEIIRDDQIRDITHNEELDIEMKNMKQSLELAQDNLKTIGKERDELKYYNKALCDENKKEDKKESKNDN